MYNVHANFGYNHRVTDYQWLHHLQPNQNYVFIFDVFCLLDLRKVYDHHQYFNHHEYNNSPTRRALFAEPHLCQLLWFHPSFTR